ncbi:hypothetical protein CLOSTMETH_02984 [[Clostridium] methylpentosum DSM 5476]|uniref:Uncharacterized protein n=1 Tax=[Clostridium] methylpentosum DSM 5476 TaxID=537013 RepID=C0EGJ1_9FIRM|nr:hypothetical protein CLOSTMETH_02984 [[Clostridium] methylpentosum DSM 5476]
MLRWYICFFNSHIKLPTGWISASKMRCQNTRIVLVISIFVYFRLIKSLILQKV